MKDQILQIAIRQMMSGGYDNLNFANIADELNTTRANLHHHFKNKEGLGVAATELYIQEQTITFDEIIKTHDGDIFSLLAAVENYLIEFLLGGNSFTACICSQLMYECKAPDKLRQLARNRFNAELNDFEDQVGKAIKNGVLSSSTDIGKLAFQIAATYIGIGQLALVETDKEKLVSNIKGSLVSLVE